ncbi:MAG TPA: ABC transporter substrate-binding protein [Acetobacteraceae bacterium]|nr:ABC transporter substrate-binding protein [Acetobacteraceae bacterium]
MRVGGVVLAGLLLASAASASAEAAVFKWANNGDAGALDPDTREETVQLSFLSNIYEPLVQFDQHMKLQPALATSWKMVAPTVWEFQLRPGVKFSDGTPFTADDVVFSAQRLKSKFSQLADVLGQVTEVKKTGPLTVQLVTRRPDPILPFQMVNFLIMSKAWCEQHDATLPVLLTGKQSNYAVLHANGTGPYEVVSREPDRLTVLQTNPNWWGKLSGNVTRAEFYIISNDATRIAALLSGQVDMLYDTPPQDALRIAHTPGFHLITGPELRTVFLGMDQSRPQLLESSVKGKNPFKDIRVREAFALAIDENAIAQHIMLGFAHPTWMMWGPGVNGYDAKLDHRPAVDPAKARQLLAEAGYPNGFEVGMDCPNDRYVNDAEICTAVVSMLAKIGIKVDLLAQEKTKFFAKIDPPNYDTSFYMLGWTPATTDAENSIYALIGTRNGRRGLFNVGGFSDPKVDALDDEIQTETDQAKRDADIDQVAQIVQQDWGYIPLHQQVIIYSARNGVEVVQRPDNYFQLRWVSVQPPQ